MSKPSGIANLGNTCYMNSALQCGIISCAPLVEYFLSDQYLEDLTIASSDSLSKALAWLLDELHHPETRGGVYPSMVKARIDAKLPRFKGTLQHDCSEFLLEMLDLLHLELSRKTSPMGGSLQRSSSLSMLTRSSSTVLGSQTGSFSGKSMSAIDWQAKGSLWWRSHRKSADSIIKRLFEGAIRSVMTCQRCGGVSARFEPFMSLVVPVGSSGDPPTSPTGVFVLEDLIGELFKPEELEDIDCDFCKRKQRFNRTIDIWKLPPYLILTLSRFSFDFSTGLTARKLNNFVEYPIDELNLSYLVSSESVGDKSGKSGHFELYSVVEHQGTVNRGHYTALIKNAAGKEQWYQANDGRVSVIDDSDRILTDNAYMLFYKSKLPQSLSGLME